MTLCGYGEEIGDKIVQIKDFFLNLKDFLFKKSKKIEYN